MNKKQFSLQSITDLTVLNPLYCKETSSLDCFAYIALGKSPWKIKLGEYISDQKYFAK